MRIRMRWALTAGMAGVLVAAAPVAGAGPAFVAVPGNASPEDFDFNGQKRAVAGGDVTGDGRPDIVMAGSSVWVVRAGADPAAPGEYVPVGAPGAQPPNIDPSYDDVVLADVGGDARLDIVAAGPGGVRRFTASDAPGGGPAFLPDDAPLLDGVVDSDAPWSLAAGDVDGDGRTDLAVAGPLGAHLLRQTAPGTFAAPVAALSGTALDDVALGELTGDGRIDLAVAYAGGALVLAQSADGASLTAGSVLVTGPVLAVAVARVDADGAPDLVASRPAAGQVVTRLRDANGGFSGSVTTGDLLDPGTLVAADFDGDGVTDVAVATRHPGPNPFDDIRDLATVLRGAGDGAFAPAATIDVSAAGQEDIGNDLRSMVAADMDRDGLLDLLFADNALSAALVARNSTTLTPGGNVVDVVVDRGGGGTPAGPGLYAVPLARQRITRKMGILVQAGCAVRCTVRAGGRVAIGRGRRPVRFSLRVVNRTLSPGPPVRLSLKVPARRWPLLARALARRIPVRAVVTVKATGPDGVVTIQTLTLRLGRR